MKTTFYLVCLFIIGTIASCSKSQSPDKTNVTNGANNDPLLEGNWKMVLYIDSANGTTENIAQSYLHPNVFSGTLPYPPAGEVQMKVVFDNSSTTQGTITGTGIMNGCILHFTVTPQRSFAKTGFIRTLAEDPPWGEYFFTYLPLANSYSFDGDSTLRMQIPGKSLIFTRQ